MKIQNFWLLLPLPFNGLDYLGHRFGVVQSTSVFHKFLYDQSHPRSRDDDDSLDSWECMDQDSSANVNLPSLQLRSFSSTIMSKQPEKHSFYLTPNLDSQRNTPLLTWSFLLCISYFTKQPYLTPNLDSLSACLRTLDSSCWVEFFFLFASFFGSFPVGRRANCPLIE